MRTLVTGANGFVGSHLVRHLLNGGHSVRAMVRRSSNLELLADTNPEYVYADVTDDAGLDEAVAGVDVVFHVAGVIAALTDDGFDRVNLGGTQKLFAAVQRTNPDLGRFVFTSSMAAAGPAPAHAPRKPDDEPAPTSAYGRSKLRAENWLRQNAGDVRYTIVRPPVVYGSGDAATLDLYVASRRGVAARMAGPDRPLSFVHVRDLVAAMERCATADEAVGRAWFICGGEDITMDEFQRRIGAVLGTNVRSLTVPTGVLRAVGAVSDAVGRMRNKPPVLGADKVSDALQTSWRMDGSAAHRELGFWPEWDFDRGIREAVAWYRANGRL